MELLPDLVGHEPRVVFCGMAGADSSRLREHYYATPGNNFWAMLHLSGLTPELLRPQDDGRLLEHGLGVTDLVHHRDPERYDVEELVEKVVVWAPEWVAFASKTVAQAAARSLGVRRPQLGVAPWDLGGAGVFVLPGTSGANQRHDYDGRPNRLAWWRDLAALVGVVDAGGVPGA